MLKLFNKNKDEKERLIQDYARSGSGILRQQEGLSANTFQFPVDLGIYFADHHHCLPLKIALWIKCFIDEGWFMVSSRQYIAEVMI